MDGPGGWCVRLIQIEKDKYYYFTSVWNPKTKPNKIETDTDTENKLLVARGEG